MPQMMPINWIFFLFFFICIFLIFNIMNYFIYEKKMHLINKFNQKKKLTFNWKW
ncbi:ATP synthase F0 subunit 8 (mitochondrion) [Bombyx mori]|uniref:ATP synthase protein 8 n=3 Tax=Bombyx TaxID=7090 RepID=ATP8_BOMMO|nr:ATP synthase F0 subunit 8 [Bombyx mori]YP_010372101.1 ATP synthase F0 subunit 8 [Leucoma salicis]Q9ME79.1 RecName: Full=ATP synthase protein 8; AltName: Full=A6L; AltName: Full=F-ATPase subunit 8 [Bombyx mori]ACJ06190.1 ATPase subunit 8 [Bombyx mandarina]AAF33753.1 ATP synthase F0 subunit 8 [Bombyx mori]AAF73767.1 ATPase 8 [Bombyx mori]AAK85721.1 ATPase subunit 8 [Bombyx mori]ADE18238.1 ATP synthase F0 subunit 8 [Bombyx mori]